MKTFSKIAVMLISVSTFFACNSDVVAPKDLSPSESLTLTKPEIFNEKADFLGIETEDQKAAAAIEYSVKPALNTWTAATTGATQKLSCATYYPGIRSKVIAQNGNKFTVQLQRNDGKPFNGTGIAYIKALNLCGTIAGNTPINTASFYYINVDFWATFSSGSVVFVPTFTIKGIRYYSNPITVSAKEIVNPSLNVKLATNTQGGLAVNTVYGYINNVAVNSNGPLVYLNSRGGHIVNGVYFGEKWQCVELMRRFYYQNFNYLITKTGNAKTYFGQPCGSPALKSYSNGGSVPPAPGDILCITNSGAGHVAIITEVGRDYIKIAQQNVGADTAIGLKLARNGNRVSDYAGTIQGWMRR